MKLYVTRVVRFCHKHFQIAGPLASSWPQWCWFCEPHWSAVTGGSFSLHITLPLQPMQTDFSWFWWAPKMKSHAGHGTQHYLVVGIPIIGSFPPLVSQYAPIGCMEFRMSLHLECTNWNLWPWKRQNSGGTVQPYNQMRTKLWYQAA